MKVLSEKATKTITQLVREFSIPFIAATTWTVSALWGQTLNVQTVGANFGPAFFFASWMTGQFFRVRKQAGVESSLVAVERRIQSVIDRLEIQTQQFIGHLTGGSSYCHVVISRQVADESIWVLVPAGDYPMYSINVRIADLDSTEEDVAKNHLNDRSFTIAELSPGQGRILDPYNLGSGDSRRFNVYISARNGTFVQRIRLRRINGAWRVATQVETNDAVVHTHVDEEYPGKMDGVIEWS